MSSKVKNVEVPSEKFLAKVLQTSQRKLNGLDEKSLKLTSEEAQQFEKAFADDEFRKLLADYVFEISDPKHRAEQDAYIRQLESQNEVPEGKQIIWPTPAFVYKFKYLKKPKEDLIEKGAANTKETGQTTEEKAKLFINVVTSSKIDKPTCKLASRDSSGKRKHWSVPYSLGPLRLEPDKFKSLVPTFDCCFHPDAIIHSGRVQGFQDLLVQSARDGAVRQYSLSGEDIEIDKSCRILKGVSYKNGTPPAMLISDKSFLNEENPPSENKKKVEKSKETKTIGKNSHPLFIKGFLENSKKNMAKSTISNDDKEVDESKLSRNNTVSIPKYTLAEQNPFDISNSNPSPCRPSHLVYRVKLPKITHVSEIDLGVSPKQLALKSLPKSNQHDPFSYALDLRMPYEVNCDDIKAKWDKSKHELTILIAVIPSKIESCEMNAPQFGYCAEISGDGNDQWEMVQKNITDRNVDYSKKAKERKGFRSSDHSRWISKTPKYSIQSLDASSKMANANDTSNYTNTSSSKTKSVVKEDRSKLVTNMNEEETISLSKIEENLQPPFDIKLKDTRLSSKLRCIKTQSKEKLAPVSQVELIHDNEMKKYSKKNRNDMEIETTINVIQDEYQMENEEIDNNDDPLHNISIHAFCLD